MAVIPSPDRCNGCGLCVAVCPREAIDLIGGKVAVDGTVCRECGACRRACPREALALYGRRT